MKIRDLKESVKEDRGFILILALVTMLAMTLIGISLVMNMTTDMQLSRNEREAKRAFQLAEAGIKEATARLHLASSKAQYIGEKSGDANYRATGWNVGNSLGRDFSSNAAVIGALAPNQSYSVTIRYLDETNPEGFCDSNNAVPNNSGNALTSPSVWDCSTSTTPPEVVMYGRDFKLTDSLTKISYGKLPIYRLVSTGTSNGTERKIEAYVGASSLNTDTEAGVNTNACISVAGGAAVVSGGVREGGSGGCTTCDDSLGGCVAKASTDNMTTYLGEDLSSIIDMADEKHTCKNLTCSSPGDDIPASGAIDTVVTDWGLPASDPNTHSTLVYIDNSGGNAVSLSGNYTGRGILIVSGDLKLSGTLAYEGLVYVLGKLIIGGGGGSLNVLGGVMANDMVTLSGSISATYDKDTLDDVGRQTSGTSAVLWKRY